MDPEIDVLDDSKDEQLVDQLADWNYDSIDYQPCEKYIDYNLIASYRPPIFRYQSPFKKPFVQEPTFLKLSNVK